MSHLFLQAYDDKSKSWKHMLDLYVKKLSVTISSIIPSSEFYEKNNVYSSSLREICWSWYPEVKNEHQITEKKKKTVKFFLSKSRSVDFIGEPKAYLVYNYFPSLS